MDYTSLNFKVLACGLRLFKSIPFSFDLKLNYIYNMLGYRIKGN